MTGPGTALAAIARGWWVFPVRARDKRPAVKDWPRVATSDPAAVTSWAPGCNTGVDCDRSGLVLVDIDGPAGAQGFARACGGRILPPTLTVATPRTGGVHLWFLQAPGMTVRNTAGRIAAGVDTRGPGGYGLAPGSVVDRRAYRHHTELQNGGAYVIVADHPPAVIPRWLAEPAQPSTATHLPGAAPVDRPGDYGAAALAGECGRLRAMPPDSGRNCQLNTSSWRLGQLAAVGIIGQAVITAALMDAAAACRLVADDGEAACLATIRSGLTAGMASPRRPVVRYR